MVALALAASPALAQTQRKDCGELKSEIEAKIKNNGVKVFTLTVVDKDAAEDGKVVGTCDGGTNKIVYKRGAVDAPRETTGEAKSQTGEAKSQTGEAKSQTGEAKSQTGEAKSQPK
jgi:hypothetical protein